MTSSFVAAAFERRVRRLHAFGRHARAPCVLDICAENSSHFAIGALDLVAMDLHRVLEGHATLALESLTKSGLARAYELRRELVHFKKACLHLLREVLRVERGLVRQSTFFYQEFGRCEVPVQGCCCARCDCGCDCGGWAAVPLPAPGPGRRLFRFFSLSFCCCAT